MKVPADLGPAIRWLGALGGLGGIAAGLIQIAWGAEIPGWSGAKDDPVVLGAVTVALAIVAVIAAARVGRARTGGQRAALTASLAVPAVVCFTTVGALWWVPGATLLSATALAGVHARRAGGVRQTLATWWGEILVGALAVVYLGLGVMAWGILGALGAAGAAAIAAGVWLTPRSRSAAAVLLAAGAVPFAVAGWWTVVAPLAGLLVLMIGFATVNKAAGRRAHLGRIGADQTTPPTVKAYPWVHVCSGTTEIAPAGHSATHSKQPLQ